MVEKDTSIMTGVPRGIVCRVACSIAEGFVFLSEILF